MLPLMEKLLHRKTWKEFPKTVNRQSQEKDTATQLIQNASMDLSSLSVLKTKEFEKFRRFINALIG